MTQEELKEKRERFRVYGEICLLMEENGCGFVDDFDIDADELEEALGEPILVFTDDDDDHAKKLEDIEFLDCMLLVGCSNEQAMFMDVCSWTLHQIYEALKNFFKKNRLWQQ